MKTLEELQKEKEELELIRKTIKKYQDSFGLSTSPSHIICDIDNIITEIDSQLTPKINRNEAGLFVPGFKKEYFYLNETNELRRDNNEACIEDDDRIKIGNCQPDLASAKKAQLRRESMIPTFLPKVGEPYLLLSFRESEDLFNVLSGCIWTGSSFDWINYHLGLIYHPDNRKEAEDWGVKYREAWRGL